ncbi:cAMP-specific 3',5'-cyclic phosphodiesterase 4D [Terramyces sp. JEL0728]|nr:cAMP-specific 3',5'-cyclic phosphodiesterase 4D [Terramyces sp. JEL0728]
MSVSPKVSTGAEINDGMEVKKTITFTDKVRVQQHPGQDELDSVRRDSFMATSPDKLKNEAHDVTESQTLEDHASLLSAFLSFRSPDLESEFSSYFVALNLARWRKTLTALFSVLSVLYIYFIASDTIGYDQYSTLYLPAINSGASITCPTGVYCNKCNPNYICNSYDPIYDAAFWFVVVLVPYILGLGSCYYIKPQVFYESIDLVTSLVVFFQIFIGVGVRTFVIEAQLNFLQPTLVMTSLLLLSFFGVRARFIHTLLTVGTITFVWIIMNIVAMILNSNIPSEVYGAFGLGFACIIITSGVVTFTSYETEHFYRMQFLMSKDMKKHNAKLKNQLLTLAKSYNQKAVKSIESPLERSMMVIRSVMADPGLSSRHLLALGQVTSLLGSSNLLTPDFESTIGDSMDNEQQAWLFSEIAARRRKGRGKSNYRRRLSTTAENPPINAKTPANEEESTPAAAEPEVNATGAVVATPPLTGDDRRISNIAQDPRAVYPPEIEEIATLLTRYNEYDFNLFELSRATGNRTLMVLSHHLFAQAKLFEAFLIPLDKFGNCISAIEKGYHADLPCNKQLTIDHNSLHATDVLHCIHCLANTTKIKDIWSDIELLGMYFAAIIHDHDHPGYTNNFLVATSDPKAILYNDKAVLENHHSASSFVVLAKPENNFLAHLTKAEFKSIREIVVDLVLATDLTQHFALLSMFKSKVASAETFDPYETREDRMLLFKIMIKCSDVSNPTKDLPIYKQWTRLIMTEFVCQGDLEKKLNLPVSPYMDRDNVNVASCQIGFIDYVVQPLFGALDSYQTIPSITSRLAKNREYW